MKISQVSHASGRTERDPLLPRRDSESPHPGNGTFTPAKATVVNHVSKSTLVWILFGLWSAVFLGALDGE